MSSFKASETERQARFRDESPTISLVGRTPSDTAGRKHRHLLALCHESENLIPSARGPGGIEDFFHARAIKWWKGSQTGDSSIPGPTRNLASSQILCVNFLFPLVKHANVLTSLLQTIDDDVVSIDLISHKNLNSSPSLVEFEWVGVHGPLEEGKTVTRGANVTSVDAFMVARVRSGGLRAYLMEWKYTENYPVKRDEAKDATRRRRYLRLYKAPSSPLDNSLPITTWFHDPFYQVTRLLLLGQRMVDQRELGITEATVVVVCPSGNVEYRDRITSPGLKKYGDTVESVFRNATRKPGAFRMTDPRVLLESIAQKHKDQMGGWVDYQRERYGW